MSAVLRWTWPMSTPGSIGLALRSLGVTPWMVWFFMLLSSYRHWRQPKPEPAGATICALLAASIAGRYDHLCPFGCIHRGEVRPFGHAGAVDEAPYSGLNWTPASSPTRSAIDGDLVRLEVLD